MDEEKLATMKHVLHLLERDAGKDGWVKVSAALFPFLSESMPPELAEFEEHDSGFRARLTDEGRNVQAAKKWLS